MLVNNKKDASSKILLTSDNLFKNKINKNISKTKNIQISKINDTISDNSSTKSSQINKKASDMLLNKISLENNLNSKRENLRKVQFKNKNKTNKEFTNRSTKNNINVSRINNDKINNSKKKYKSYSNKLIKNYSYNNVIINNNENNNKTNTENSKDYDKLNLKFKKKIFYSNQLKDFDRNTKIKGFNKLNAYDLFEAEENKNISGVNTNSLNKKSRSSFTNQIKLDYNNDVNKSCNNFSKFKSLKDIKELNNLSKTSEKDKEEVLKVISSMNIINPYIECSSKVIKDNNIKLDNKAKDKLIKFSNNSLINLLNKSQDNSPIISNVVNNVEVYNKNLLNNNQKTPRNKIHDKNQIEDILCSKDKCKVNNTNIYKKDNKEKLNKLKKKCCNLKSTDNSIKNKKQKVLNFCGIKFCF